MRLTQFVFLLALPLAAWAQAPLTEAEAVRQGLARADLADLARGAVQAAEADVMAAGQLPNPTLSYSRDRISGSPGSVEQTWMLGQSFDVSGRRGLQRDAASRRMEAVIAGNAGWQLERAADIRHRFHEALLRQETIRATETWATRFARIEGMVGKLARAGEASGYDRRRLEVDRQAAIARLAIERAELNRALAQLAALTGLPVETVLSGELLPSPLPPAEDALARLDQRPALRALAHRAEAAGLDGRAAKRAVMPDISVGIGPRQVDQGTSRENGLALSLSVPLPVFDRQQAGQQRAAAEALQASAEYALARHAAASELDGLHRQVDGLRAAAVRYRSETTTASPELLRIAEAAYQGGESSLLELLDAYRSALETETTALELEWRARDARIEYDLLTSQSPGLSGIGSSRSGDDSKHFLEQGTQHITGSTK